MNRFSESLRTFFRRLRALFTGKKLDRDFDQEVHTHLSLLTQENIRRGMSPEEAHYAALRSFGGVTQTRESNRRERTFHHLHIFLQDLRYAGRMMRKKPGFAAVAIITLVLGIGANTAVFSVVNGVLLRPLPYPHADRMVLLAETAKTRGRVEGMSVGWQDYLDWRRQARSFEHLGVYRNQNLNLTGSGDAERLNGALLSSDAMDAVGIRPLLGRTFVPQEDNAGTPPVAILSERLWRNRFTAAPGIINSTITLDGRNYTVVGVMPFSMRFPSRLTDIWVPLGLYVNQMPSDRGNHPGLQGVGLLKAGVSFDQARSEMETIAQRIGQQFPDTNSLVSVRMLSYYEAAVGSVRQTLLALLAAVLFVLLIACVNLANMTLARDESRLRELAVRSALGASRSRLVRQLLVESFLLSSIGASLGLLWAWAALKALATSQLTSIPRMDLLSIDVRVLIFTCFTTVVVALLFGLWPALRATTLNAQVSLKDLTHTIARRSRMRPFLVVAEVSLAMVLLVGAGLMTRTFSSLTSIDLGFRPEHVVTMRLSLPPRNYPTPQWIAFHQNLLSRIANLPSVQAEGISSLTPLSGNGNESGIFPDNVPLDADPNHSAGCTFSAVSGGYFAAMGIQMVKGRTFTEGDAPDGPPIIVVDEATASKFWPGEDPIGHRVAFEFRGMSPADPRPIWRQIVGVVHTVRHYDLTSINPRVQVYVPYTQPALWYQTMPVMSLMVRTAMEPSALVSSVRHEVAALDPVLPVFSVSTMSTYIDDVLEQPRLGMDVMAGFAALALVLAAVGIYGVLSYSVSQRTREIGIRTALGASRSNIMGFIMRGAIILIAAGVVIGVVVSLSSMRLIRGLLYGVSTTDAATYGLVAAVLILVALAATYIPARRASRIDPIVALRYE